MFVVHVMIFTCSAAHLLIRQQQRPWSEASSSSCVFLVLRCHVCTRLCGYLRVCLFGIFTQALHCEIQLNVSGVQFHVCWPPYSLTLLMHWKGRPWWRSSLITSGVRSINYSCSWVRDLYKPLTLVVVLLCLHMNGALNCVGYYSYCSAVHDDVLFSQSVFEEHIIHE